MASLGCVQASSVLARFHPDVTVRLATKLVESGTARCSTPYNGCTKQYVVLYPNYAIGRDYNQDSSNTATAVH